MGRRIEEIFREVANAFPDRTALSSETACLSYLELDRSSSQVCTSLQLAGVVAGDIVGLCLPRSTDLIVGMLAILKTGAAYLPIDPTYPDERVRLLIEQSDTTHLLVDQGEIPRLRGLGANLQFICMQALVDPGLPQNAPTDYAADDSALAYVIFTSGSTGVPKGVMVEHRNVVRLFDVTRKFFGFTERDVGVLFHSVSFDFSVWEIWSALLHGGELFVPKHELTRAPQLFIKALEERRITVLNQTPSAFRQLIAANLPQQSLSLRLIIFGGEALAPPMLAPWFAVPGANVPCFVNMYGITETTIHASYRLITAEDAGRTGSSPIGSALPDLDFMLLDDLGQPVRDEQPGELYIAGPGVARGYLNSPTLTAQRFSVDARGVRWYRTGDRMVRRAGGEHWYLGRVDDQIKVRGFRIEPAEIEVHLASCLEISACAVTEFDHGNGDVRLVAYAVPRATSGAIDEPGLIARLIELASDLPLHMRPSEYHLLSQFPMTPQGKIDRKGLSALVTVAPTAVSGMTESPAIQSRLRAIWTEVLQQPVPGVHEDFFDLGGTSIALMRVFALINKEWSVYPDISQLLDGITLASLAASIEQEQQSRSVEA